MQKTNREYTTYDCQCVPWHLGDIIVDRPSIRLIVQVHLLGGGIRMSHRRFGSNGGREIAGDDGRWGDLVTAEQSLRRGGATRDGPRRRQHGLGLVLRRGVAHPLENAHQQHVWRQVVHLGVHEDTAFRATKLAMGADDLLQALLAERVLARQHLAGRVEPLQAHRAFQQVIQHALVHREAYPRHPISRSLGCTYSGSLVVAALALALSKRIPSLI